MKSTARVATLPIHPMLILVPAGAFFSVLAFDIIYLLTDDALWWQATIPAIAVGVVGGILAAIPGLIDLVTVVPRQQATGIGLLHGVLNLAILGLFSWNGWMRWTIGLPPSPDAPHLGLWLSVVGGAALAVSSWLGWTMVYRYHVGVHEHPEALDPEPGLRGEEGEGTRGLAAD